jgi:large subunit ribosomal protein L17
MRHRISFRKLNRTSSHRRSLFSNLSNSLLEHEEICTTLAKAKSLRPVVEKLITLCKQKSLPARRKAFSFLRNNTIVNKLLYDLSPRYKHRYGGYLRIIKVGNRYGDMSPMAVIQFVGDDNKKFSSATTISTESTSKDFKE